MSVFPTGVDWPAQREEIERRIADHQRKLESLATWEDVRFEQGQIAALRGLIEAGSPEFRPGQGHATYNR